MIKERRKRQLGLIETFEDSIMMKDKVIEHLQKDQKNMMMKIQALKKDLEMPENFDSGTSRTMNGDHESFVNDITQRLTFAKMNMGYSSNGKQASNLL